jgi:hypothetical protein
METQVGGERESDRKQQRGGGNIKQGTQQNRKGARTGKTKKNNMWDAHAKRSSECETLAKQNERRWKMIEWR